MLAFDRLEPFGNVEPTYMAATICAIIVNSLQSMFAKKGSYKVIPPSKFIPEWSAEPEEPKEQTVDEQKAILLSIAGALGAKDNRRKK